MSLKVAIVGCGKVADAHVEEVQKMPQLARIVAVCDSELLMAEQLAVRYGIPGHYDQFEKLLEREKPDVVHITTPPQSHLSLAQRAIAAGCHVFVEKPLTPNLAEAEQLVAQATQTGRKLTIGYTYLFDPPALALRTMRSQGILGDIVHAESFFGYNLAGAFGSAVLNDPHHWVLRLPGMLFQNNIDHMLNKLVEFVDDDRPSVRALACRRSPKHWGDTRDRMQDELRVMLQGRGTSAYGTFSCAARPTAHFVRVYGTQATAHVDYVLRTVTLEPAPQMPSALGKLVPPFGHGWQYAREGARNVLRFARGDFHFFAGLNRLLTLYYESILNDTPPPIAYRDILWVARVMEEIFQQINREDGNP